MNPIRILLVDDHPLFRQRVTWTLTTQPDLEIIGEVADGQAAVGELGLTNLTLHHASILDIDDSYGPFDYILCHGVYSWVPTEAVPASPATSRSSSRSMTNRRPLRSTA